MKEREKLATKIMMNALEGVKAQIRKAYDESYKDGYVAGYDHGKRDGKADTPFTDTEEAENKAYNRGLNDAWDAARKLVHRINGGYTETEKKIIFDTSTSDSILLNYTATEAIAKIKAYEDKQKQDAEIKVGDEVIVDDGVRAIVIGKSYGLYLAIAVDFSLHEAKEYKKTGRHFPQIAEVLKEMRGNK